MEPDRETLVESSILWRTRVMAPGFGRLVSRRFTAGGTQCTLQIYNCSDGIVRLFLGRERNPSTPFQVTAYLSNGENLFLPQRTIVNDPVVRIWECPHSEILKQSEVSFRIIVHDTGHLPSEDKSVQTPPYSDASFGIQSLSQDLSKLLDVDVNSDVEFECGGTTFKAHRSLLSVRSEVFQAMLNSDMTEGKTGQVKIVDTEAGLFGYFLHYLYTGKLEELTVDKAIQLYELGDKYGVEALKTQCSSFLADNLSRTNACDILSLADRHTDDNLKEIAILFILNKKIPLAADSWANFCEGHPVLANKVLNRFCQFYVSTK